MTNEDLSILFYDLVDGVSKILQCTKKTGGGSKKEFTCLHVLQDPKLRLQVEKYLTNLERKMKEEKDQLIIEWYKYPIAYPNNGNVN